MCKLDSIRKNMSENLETTVFIKGGKKLYSKNEFYIQENVGSKNIKSIDCYCIDDVENQMKDLVCQYDGVLNTAGKIKL